VDTGLYSIAEQRGIGCVALSSLEQQHLRRGSGLEQQQSGASEALTKLTPTHPINPSAS